MSRQGTDVIGAGMEGDNAVDNRTLIEINDAIRNHPVEYIGAELRSFMTNMKSIV
jgi:ketol-acid reductoisomerase